MRYSYWLLRYVPDTVRGEMVNVGVLVGRDGGDWALRRVRSFRRANRLGGDAASLAPWLQAVEREIEDYSHPPLEAFVDKRSHPFTEARVRRLRARLNNSLQISDPVVVEGKSASSSAAFLFDFLVSEAAITPRSMTRRNLVSALREQYDSVALSDVGRSLRTSPRAHVGRQRGRFDFAVLEDDVAQLSQVWSFDLTDMDKLEQDIHAWSFLVTKLRNDGGYLSEAPQGPTVVIDSAVPISAVYQLPSSRRSAQQDVFLAAQEAWQALDVDLVPSAELDRVAHSAVLPGLRRI